MGREVRGVGLAGTPQRLDRFVRLAHLVQGHAALKQGDARARVPVDRAVEVAESALEVARAQGVEAAQDFGCGVRRGDALELGGDLERALDPALFEQALRQELEQRWLPGGERERVAEQLAGERVLPGVKADRAQVVQGRAIVGMEVERAAELVGGARLVAGAQLDHPEGREDLLDGQAAALPASRSVGRFALHDLLEQHLEDALRGVEVRVGIDLGNQEVVPGLADSGAQVVELVLRDRRVDLRAHEELTGALVVGVGRLEQRQVPAPARVQALDVGGALHLAQVPETGRRVGVALGHGSIEVDRRVPERNALQGQPGVQAGQRDDRSGDRGRAAQGPQQPTQARHQEHRHEEDGQVQVAVGEGRLAQATNAGQRGRQRGEDAERGECEQRTGPKTGRVGLGGGLVGAQPANSDEERDEEQPQADQLDEEVRAALGPDLAEGLERREADGDQEVPDPAAQDLGAHAPLGEPAAVVGVGAAEACGQVAEDPHAQAEPEADRAQQKDPAAAGRGPRVGRATHAVADEEHRQGGESELFREQRGEQEPGGKEWQPARGACAPREPGVDREEAQCAEQGVVDRRDPSDALDVQRVQREQERDRRCRNVAAEEPARHAPGGERGEQVQEEREQVEPERRVGSSTQGKTQRQGQRGQRAPVADLFGAFESGEPAPHRPT